MEIYLTHKTVTRAITGVLSTWTWSGDKGAICRQLEGEVAYTEGSSLPVPELGDLVTLSDGGKRLFVGEVLRRELASEAHTMTFVSFDYGFYFTRNDGSYKFTGDTAEAITARVCADRSIPVAALPSTGVALRRKFPGVPLGQIVSTVWSLAAERTGKRYAIRYTPEGLRVTERSVSTSNPVLKAASNLMDAATREDATAMVNSVAVYDSDGNLLRRTGDAEAQRLYGVMESHLTARKGEDASSQAAKVLEDGKLQRTVTVNVLGDTSLLTGETVVVREARTGLSGVFWIDADVHTWKNNNYYCRLTLNCRNVMATASAGSDLK